MVKQRLKFFLNRRGFTLIDLLVAATVVIIMLSFGLARFRTGQFSNELDVSTKQLSDGVSTVRNYNLAGRTLVNSSLPDGGYGVRFDLASPDKFKLFAVVNAAAEILPKGTSTLSGVDLKSFCGLNKATVTTLPCQGASWNNIGNYLEIIFTPPGKILANFSDTGTYQYVGGVIEHQRTGQKAYFYISLTSGLITQGLL
ncbi:MAG: hypothetical protein PHW95_03015 [Patescibacteria group bacterium]|nr:hypothetical protein [Patescibacteria group bacterium]